MVVLAEHFIGKGLELAIYDEEVNLSRLLGANKRFIEMTIPHIADLMTSDCRELVRKSEVLVVGSKEPTVVKIIQQETRLEQSVLDLVRVPEAERLRCEYQGVCW
jgi:GDP-mannose 6-dehydrogenase